MRSIVARRQISSTKRRKPDPIEPDLNTIVFTLSMSLVGIMMAIQATDAISRTLAWASILGCIILGATGRLANKLKLDGNRFADRAWITLLVLTTLCEIVSMMYVRGMFT